ncbi:MAG: 30S ribosomal protein S8 [Candidatus Yonathbacteria bacterium]|nr:30S ribosomal protein S8 [Candidatus Yonathbacteria bacterium]
MVTDPIADLLVRIKNAGNTGLPSTIIPYSQLKFEIASLLQKEGYIGSVSKKGKKAKKVIEVSIAYTNKKPRIADAARVSKPSRRVYMGVSDIKPVRHGYGLLVLSTPKGIMTDKEARKEHVGGEALFKIW